MSALVRPSWDTAKKIIYHRDYVCTCGDKVCTDRKLQAHWMQGHFDGITEIEASEPAPVYRPAYVTVQCLRLVALLFTLAGLVAGGLIGAGIMRLIR